MARGAAKLSLTAPIVREPILHRQIADILRLELAPPGRLSRDGVLWYSVDMAAYAGSVPGIRTGRGAIAGIPDIVVLYLGAGFFIEVKADDGCVSPAQAAVATELLRCGAHYGIARDAREALALLDHWEVPRRGAVRI